MPEFTLESTEPGFGGSTSVLGKLSNMIIAPSNFGASQENWLAVFVTMEQAVGNLMVIEGQVWVEAPPTFEFGQYCAVKDLDTNYYIPEAAVQTLKLPFGVPPECYGAISDDEKRSYNVARIMTVSRLLANRLYGFRLMVVNAPWYVYSQRDGWRMWTYSKAGDGVDGAFETIRFNQQVAVGPNTSFGIYPLATPQANFRVEINDLRPGMPPTEIKFFPIIVQTRMQKAVRILAPAGYMWDFQQYDFRYKARGPGVMESQIVDGVDADLPIAGVPSKPIGEPRNQITINYMSGPWLPGLIYGFVAKISVPIFAPTGSANQFSIEFGYSENQMADRLEGGVFDAPLVKRLIYGGISFTTNIQAQASFITFEFRVISDIPRAGGIVIVGPPNFRFEPMCQPKPEPGYPNLPVDLACLYEVDRATLATIISLVAGGLGFPALQYKFTLSAINPPTQVPTATAGTWSINSYSLVSEKIVLDQKTIIQAYPTNKLMPKARFEMWPKVPCLILTAQEMIDMPQAPRYDCQLRDLQFYPPFGFRDDRPSAASALVISFVLDTDSDGEDEIILRAPVGYYFDTNCQAVLESSRVFDDTQPIGSQDIQPPTEEMITFMSMGFTPWPKQAELRYCQGDFNNAHVMIKQGLKKRTQYAFRIAQLRNPASTPKPNKFTLEYNGESSESFEGITIWAFEDGAIIPTTRAASVRDRESPGDMATVNVVTIQLRPTKDVLQGGMVRVEAPSGFLIRGKVVTTQCQASLRVHPDEMPNISAIPIGTLEALDTPRWAEFFDDDITCRADETPSSRCRLIIGQGKRLKSGVLYLFQLTVWNPQTTDAVGQPWRFVSSTDLTLNYDKTLDSVYLPGFPINSVVRAFAYMTPMSKNANVKQLLDFNMSFPLLVGMGESIQIVAPVTYFFNSPGSNNCPKYLFLEGALRRTQPECGANTITWYLTEESIPMKTAVRFLVQVQNPERTPELNLFQIRHRGSDGEWKSSRMIDGYDIIPEPYDTQIFYQPPVAPCRPSADLVHGTICQATGSSSAILVRIMPTMAADIVGIRGAIGEESFDFSEANLDMNTDTATPPTIYKQSTDELMIRIAVRVPNQANMRIDNILLPETSGEGRWTVTTYNQKLVSPAKGIVAAVYTELPRDSKVDMKAIKVLGYIQTMESSRVSPIYYGALAATIYFELRPDFSWEATDVLRITRPTGYAMQDGTLNAFGVFKVGEHGLDKMRKWATSYENPEYYFAVLDKKVYESTTITFSVKSKLPDIPYQDLNWFFDTYKVMPLTDTDGEVLDTSQAPYPWLGREIELYGTNDGAFIGFPLVGQIPFTVIPSLKTPGAEIQVIVNFGLAAQVQAKDYLVLDVRAPQGFTFDDSCLKESSNLFSRCTGYRNTASLTTVQRTLAGTDIVVRLSATSPGETPIPNMWTLTLFKGKNTNYENWSQKVGYEISEMRASYRGNNQLQTTSTSFFTFTPMRPSPSPIVFMYFYPPANAGYNLNCQDVEALAFKEVGRCESLGLNMPLELRFDNASLIADAAYTVGIGVSNPGGLVLPADNMWGLLLKDFQKQTFDGNLRMPGLLLKSWPVESGLLGWTSPEPRVMSVIVIQIKVHSPMEPGVVKTMEIQAPNGIMFSEDPASVTVAPKPLPLREANPTQVRGATLVFNLDVTQAIEARSYNLRFEVSNPGSYPTDNTWSFRVMKDIEIEYVHVFAGYVSGQQSPFEVFTGPGVVGGARPRRGVVCAALLATVPFFVPFALLSEGGL
eukprot:TRINITY_DN34085_c0_g1_i1.p1 TRINITY_DN34085_c0_g1~~TRINITY_DN34085_c0_g1_i1.p1  ORF type:complete len:1924 (-),score=275.54 TRINITY_DN34085_c0_g1_i1:157-5412(-)